jgi:hypothetical protein
MYMKKPHTSKDGNSKLTVLQKQQDYGIYVWQMDHNGKAFGDGRGNVMNIPGNKYDLGKMAKVKEAAHHYNAPAGKVIFMPGVRRVSDMEYSEQLGRMKEGHIASETDIGAWMDAEKGLKANGE